MINGIASLICSDHFSRKDVVKLQPIPCGLCGRDVFCCVRVVILECHQVYQVLVQRKNQSRRQSHGLQDFRVEKGEVYSIPSTTE